MLGKKDLVLHRGLVIIFKNKKTVRKQASKTEERKRKAKQRLEKSVHERLDSNGNYKQRW